MAINEVIYGNKTLMNLKNDTVNENNLLKGATAHDASGNEIEGKVVVADVIDNLDSESSDDALSANMGRLLNEKISNTRLATDLENIDEAGIERIKEIANEEIPDEIVIYDDDYEEETTEVPRDADRLGGQLPSYYSKKSELDAEISRATAAENAINNSLNHIIGLTKKIGFTNGKAIIDISSLGYTSPPVVVANIAQTWSSGVDYRIKNVVSTANSITIESNITTAFSIEINLIIVPINT